MLYFLLIDHQRHHHHTYWTHFPIVWFSLTLAAIGWLLRARDPRPPLLAVLFAVNGFGHMLLDTIVGGIWWFAPFANWQVHMFDVPSLYRPWWLNFIFHWSFGFEIALVLWAGILLRRSKNNAAAVTVQLRG